MSRTFRFAVPVSIALATSSFGALVALGASGCSPAATVPAASGPAAQATPPAPPAAVPAASSASTPAPTEIATRAPVASTAHGIVRLAGEALGDVPLTATQRAHVEQLATDAEERHADARDARKGLILALADQVQAGHLDRASLGPKVDALAGDLQKAQPADRAAFEELHGVLNADQRVAFVDALEAHAKEHMGAMRGEHPLAKWAGDLKLTDAQKSKLRAAFKTHMKDGPGKHEHAWGKGNERRAKILTAFKDDHFVFDEVAPPADVAKQVAKTSERMFSLAETALTVLTPEQRSLAAQKLRERADALEDIGPSAPAL